MKIGPKRTPIHTPRAARELAEHIAGRPGVRLVGMMSYEGHIAGLGDRVAGARLKSAVIARMQRASYRELRERRAAAVGAVAQVAELEFVNAGGTGDLELVATEPAMTEATAGSGFYAPTLFDHYAGFTLEPAALFALPVSRRPGRGVVTALGGGYLASGPGAKDRLPSPYLPPGLALDPLEGAGEVQTPLRGPGRRPPARGRPRLPPPHEGRRAVRALQPPLPARGRADRRRGAHLPRRGQELPVTCARPRFAVIVAA